MEGCKREVNSSCAQLYREAGEETIWGRFNAIANMYSQDCALELDGEFVSYDELRSCSLSIAYYLESTADLAGDKNNLIFINLESIKLRVAAMLASLRLGIPYVVLSYGTDPHRNIEIVGESEVPVILINSEDFDRLNEMLPGKIGENGVVLDVSEVDFSFGLEGRITSNPNAQDIAYVIFTSGSTGKPKGVMQRQNNVLYFIDAYKNGLGLSRKDKVAMFASFGFDAAVMDMYGALLSGACLLVYDFAKHGFVDLASFIRDTQTTIFHSTPTVFRGLKYSSVDSATFSSIRAIVLGGEEALVEDFNFYKRYFPDDCVFVNGYGPSESTLAAQAYLNKSSQVDRRIPIGHPIEGTSIQLLDEERTENGFRGEIAIISKHVSIGYWQEEALTKKQFNKLDDGRYLYKSGDVGEIDENGVLYFCSRKEGRIKINGYLVETAEIIRVITSVEGVREAIVLEEPKNSLTAWVTCGHNVTSVNREFIYEQIKQKLPAYMLPREIYVLENFPMRANGKTDIQVLLETTPKSDGRSSSVPVSMLEAELLELWGEVLKLRVVSTSDEFICVGGHSLAALILSSRVWEQHRVKLSLRDFFEGMTIKRMASLIEERRGEHRGTEGKPDEQELQTEVESVSDAQKGIWVASQIDEDKSLYNTLSVLKVEGGLEIDRLVLAIEVTLRRYPILTTVYQLEKGCLRKHILPEAKVVIHRWDAAFTGSLEGGAEQVSQFVSECNSYQFDLERELLVRVSVLEISPLEHIVAINIHHIVVDNRSIDLVLKSVFSAYEKGVETEVMQQPICMMNPSQEEYIRSSKYWNERLKNVSGSCQLAYACNQLSSGSTEIGAIPFEIEPRAAWMAKKCCEDACVSEYMLYLTAFMFTISRYAGSNSIMVGSPFLGKDVPVDYVGPYLNVLPLILNLDESQTFSELLKNVKSMVVSASERSHVTWPRVIEERSKNGLDTPSMQMLFTFDHGENYYEFGGLKATQLQVVNNRAKYDLCVSLNRQGANVVGEIQFRKAVYDSILTEEFLENYKELIAKIPELLNVKISGLDPFRNRPAIKDNSVELVFKSVPKQIEEQAAKIPEKVAVVCGSEKLTYQSLGVKSDYYAHALLEAGIKKGDYVPVIITNPLSIPVAFLAIWKIGGVLAPLDASLPVKAIEKFLEEMDAKVVVIDDTSGSISRSPIYIDHIAPLMQCDIPAIEVDADDPMYVMFTSGTTGAPKGAINFHKGIINRFDYMTREFDCGDTVVLQTTQYCYDSIIWEVFWPLTIGGKTILQKHPSDVLDAEKLIGVINEHNVTLIDFVPSVFSGFLDHLSDVSEPQRCVGSLADVIVGSDKLPRKEVVRFRKLLPSINLINAYGPTETSIGVVFYKIPMDVPETIYIGSPIQNVEVYVMDENQRRVPFGVPGELYIGGICVGGGYFNNAQATKDSFILNPFSSDQSDLLYKTGDIVRYSPSGEIEFLGRKDRQTKIHGHRLELSGIESVIKDVEGVKEAVVIVSETGVGPQLVAYIVPAEHQNLVDMAVKRQLEECLPRSLRPSRIVYVQSLIFSVDGCLDCAATDKLILKKLTMLVVSEDLCEGERNIKIVLSRLVNIDENSFGVNDSFFDIGLTSFLAIQFVAELAHGNIGSVRITDIFQYPNIRQLYKFISGKGVNGRVKPDCTADNINKRRDMLARKKKIVNTIDGTD